MSTIKCMIIDDDYGSILVIEKFLNQLNEFEIIGSFTDSLEAYSEIRSVQPDLIFLDVQMPNLSGIELIKLISGNRNIILTTASNKYAVEGFELDIIDYLMKPLKFDRFLKAVNKFKKLTEQHNGSEIEKRKKKLIYVKENYKTIRIDIDQINYMESIKEYVKIITEDRIIKTKQSLKYFEELLSPFSFIRIHKSFLIPTDKIRAFTKSTVEINGKTLPIGRSYKNIIKLDETIKRIR